MDRIPAVRRAILAETRPLRALGWSALAVAVPTLLRATIDTGSTLSPFVTYYPAVALAALFLGWRWGVGVAVASTAVANRLFAPESLWDVLTGPNALILVLFALSCGVLVLTGEMARRLVRALQAAQEREALLNHELMHRVKNMLATVSALATLTARHSTPEQFPAALHGRMRALQRATELLAVGENASCDLGRLVEHALAPFRAAGNFRVDGPGCELPRDACVPLSLALHELATNAAKYGALSKPEGRVELLWTIGEGRSDLLRLAWREHDGRPVVKPDKAGMGTQLLRRQRGLGRVDVDFAPDGVRCHVEIEGVRARAAAA